MEHLGPGLDAGDGVLYQIRERHRHSRVIRFGRGPFREICNMVFALRGPQREPSEFTRRNLGSALTQVDTDELACTGLGRNRARASDALWQATCISLTSSWSGARRCARPILPRETDASATTKARAPTSPHSTSRSS